MSCEGGGVNTGMLAVVPLFGTLDAEGVGVDCDGTAIVGML